MPSERVVLEAHPHWWFFWKQVAAGLSVVVIVLLSMWAGGGLATFLGWLAVLSFFGWLADTGYQFARWRTTRFAVTDHRVAYQSGLLRRGGVSIPLNRINNVNLEQSAIARMLGNGVVTIESAGETGDSVFENIPDPNGVRRVIFEQMEAQQEAGSRRDASAVANAMQAGGSAVSGAGSVDARLKQLERLLSQGTISQTEYDHKRSEILDSL